MSRKKKDSSPESPQSIGGVVFFLSLLFLYVLGTINLAFLVSIQGLSTFPNWICFGALTPIGWFFAKFAIRGHPAVFIHELKHSIISNLSGNRAKGMKIRSSHGHFEYEYTKDTAAYNAFIAVAPYWVPLFTIVTLPIAEVFGGNVNYLPIGCAALAWGADTQLNTRDISPHQTDFSILRGGFTVGVLYVIAMNYALFTLLATWVSQGLHGFMSLAHFWWQFGLALSQYLTQSR